MSDLINEYRPSMDKDVLHSWAQDVIEEMKQLQQRIAELEAQVLKLDFKRDSQAITMLFALGAHLTTMKTPITFSKNHNASPIVDIIASIIESNNLSGDCDWSNYKTPKE